MRPIALAIAVMLLLAPAALAQNNSTAEDNQTEDNQTADTEDNATQEDQGNITLPEREGHIPWGGLAIGLIVFVAAVALSRAADTGDEV